ncbi:acetyl-CoA carboxylase biotin carboxyl carrier protein [Roseococcus sp. SYP-B2431]|uniref:acetyl-CoA carboxylase biotin carboxyl carrier protein n=1 Tax=Roseococcus sp. SYP-B2431 TaxID=2496640 RepID=UPI00103924D1|nr:acetyl-CoA carboxylase biotin carboxyl carrier protein [Roseococcus sp. SYP-B2431]TCH98732.1 acetyl-CoA carboxylase biotin carboxyl carrier protein [Roseococcus sp. SYP-B2431]
MTSGIQFDPEAIRKLAEILRETDLTEIELSEKDARIRVARILPAVTVAAPVMQAAAPLAAAPVPAPAPAAAAVDPSALDLKNPGLVTSPMVGVAYLSPEPGAAAFIQLGAKVAQGQTLLLIEAMKTFNQIKAPRAGTVTRILIESGTPVEYGEPLVLVE